MTRFETIQKFQDELKYEEENSRDSVVSARDFQYEDHKYTQWSDTQISQKLGIPLKYYQRMKEEEPELLINNVNTWLRKDNRRFLVRELNKQDGTVVVRAFLSDRYLPLSNRLACNTIAMTLHEMRVPFEILRQYLTECSMYLTIVSPTRYDLGEGDTVQLGIIARNSEVGYSRLQIDTFMFRHYCKNGMIFGKEGIGHMSKVHIGQRIKTSGYIDLSDVTKRLDIATTVSAIHDIVKSTFDPASFESFLSAVKAGKNVHVDDKVGAINSLKEQARLSDDIEKMLLSEFQESSQFGMANAITAVARQLPDEQSQIEMEELGGKVMLLDENSFKKAYTIKET